MRLESLQYRACKGMQYSKKMLDHALANNDTAPAFGESQICIE